MVTFANPILLLLLISVAIFALLYWYSRYRRRRQLARFGKPELLASLMPDASKYLPATKIILALGAICAMVIMLARPRTRGTVIEEELSGIEVMIAVDVSNSMRASSTDAARGVVRLDRAKHILRSLLTRLKNDRVGLIVFAGDAFTQLPLTPDFISAKMYVDEISTGMVENQGTDIGAAIQLGMNSFSGEEDVNRALIVITDAEDQIGDALPVARAAKEEGIQIDVIGLGSPKGAQIPLDGSYKNFLKDDQGKVVTTYLNEQLAQSIAEAGGGIYVNGASASALNELVEHLGEIKKANLGKINYSASDEQFPIFAWIAFVLILLDCILSNRKIGFLRKYNFFTRTGKCVALMLMCGMGANAQALMPPTTPVSDTSTRDERRFIREGNEAFEKGDYGKAELLYSRALNANQGSEAARYNLALTRLMLQPKNETTPEAGTAANEKSPQDMGRAEMMELLKAADSQIAEYAAYNLGNLAFADYESLLAQQNQQKAHQALTGALENYKNALRKNPLNEQARRNMRYVQKLLEQEQENGGGGGQDQQDQQDQQNQQDQQQQQDQNQDENKDENENKQDQQNQNQQQQDQQQNQQQQSSMSKQNRDQILNAVEAKDAGARGKVKKNQEKGHGHTRQRGKNW